MAKQDIKALAGKGDGVLTKVGSVWTYPGCPIDPSGTNLRLPMEYVSDADVQELLRDGSASAATLDASGNALAVRFDGAGRAVTAAQIGTVDAATESASLPTDPERKAPQSVNAEEATKAAQAQKAKDRS